MELRGQLKFSFPPKTYFNDKIISSERDFQMFFIFNEINAFIHILPPHPAYNYTTPLHSVPECNFEILLSLGRGITETSC